MYERKISTGYKQTVSDLLLVNVLWRLNEHVTPALFIYNRNGFLTIYERKNVQVIYTCIFI